VQHLHLAELIYSHRFENDLDSDNMSSPVTVAHYLFTRLRQLGIIALHGVPGDYNLVLSDSVEPAGLKWIGDANELNAGMIAGVLVNLQASVTNCCIFL